jgi:hypothetical protein
VYKLCLATNNDIDQLVGVLHRFFVESPYNDLCDTPDSDHISNVVSSAISKCPDTFLVLCLKNNDSVVGTFIAQILDHPFFNGTKYAQELVWFIDKEHRTNLKNTLNMLRAFDYWSKEKQCTHQVMCHLDTESGSTLTKLLTSNKHNYRKVECSFIKQISKKG